MNYYEEFVLDFAKRTRENLEFIEQHAKVSGPFEVTQLFNSMLGLLVFPQQSYMDQIPETPLVALSDWPSIQTIIAKESANNLRGLIRMMRNGVSHCNVKFISDGQNKITGLRIWNHKDGKKENPKNWEAELSINDLRTVALKFIEMMATEFEEL